MNPKPQLGDVFGIKNEVPKFTYVDRSNLDKRFAYLWNSQKHVVIHGASKQGKSCIRKRNLNEKDVLIFQCLPNKSCEIVWNDIIRTLGEDFPVQKTSLTRSTESEAVSGRTTGKIPLVLEGEVKGENTKTEQSGNSVTTGFAQGYEQDITFLAKILNDRKKRLIFEDFHYFSEDTRKQIAFHLKALYELNTFILIIGIWAEQNLLAFYNGDLSGRIEEINIGWSESELSEVLKKGEEALNITFSPELKKEMIASSFENVGLLQRIAEKICFIENVFEQQDTNKRISNNSSLDKARNDIVSDICQRYNRIKEVFEKGFRSETQLRIYYQIFRFLTEVDDKSLINGVHQNDILKKIQGYTPRTIRIGDLTQALDKIERLQSSRDITPLLISYNHSLKAISLSDREFLFFRKFSNIKWEWLEDIPSDDEQIQNTFDMRNFSFDSFKIENELTNINAEISHPDLNRKKISVNDNELRILITKLKAANLCVDFTDQKILNYPTMDMLFFIGFLYKKSLIKIQKTSSGIEIKLSETGKAILSKI